MDPNIENQNLTDSQLLSDLKNVEDVVNVQATHSNLGKQEIDHNSTNSANQIQQQIQQIFSFALTNEPSVLKKKIALSNEISTNLNLIVDDQLENNLDTNQLEFSTFDQAKSKTDHPELIEDPIDHVNKILSPVQDPTLLNLTETPTEIDKDLLIESKMEISLSELDNEVYLTASQIIAYLLEETIANSQKSELQESSYQTEDNPIPHLTSDKIVGNEATLVDQDELYDFNQVEFKPVDAENTENILDTIITNSFDDYMEKSKKKQNLKVDPASTKIAYKCDLTEKMSSKTSQQQSSKVSMTPSEKSRDIKKRKTNDDNLPCSNNAREKKSKDDYSPKKTSKSHDARKPVIESHKSSKTYSHSNDYKVRDNNSHHSYHDRYSSKKSDRTDVNTNNSYKSSYSSSKNYANDKFSKEKYDDKKYRSDKHVQAKSSYYDKEHIDLKANDFEKGPSYSQSRCNVKANPSHYGDYSCGKSEAHSNSNNSKQSTVYNSSFEKNTPVELKEDIDLNISDNCPSPISLVQNNYKILQEKIKLKAKNRLKK
jgi:hypothetical protein